MIEQLINEVCKLSLMKEVTRYPFDSSTGYNTYMNTRVIAVGRKNIISNVGKKAEIREALYRPIRISTILPPSILDYLIATYKKEGASGVSRLIENLVSSILSNVYKNHGLTFDGEISFFRLADAGIIDESTAVYFTATYLAAEGLMEDLEEAEEYGNEKKTADILHEIASKLQELISILTRLGITTIEYHNNQQYQSSGYLQYIYELGQSH